MRRAIVLTGLLLAAGLSLAILRSDAAPLRQFVQSGKAVPVDVELVLAVDISYSMDPDEQQLQREGYMKALTSGEFLRALRDGINGKIAVTYFEWAGTHDRRVVVPWRLIEGPESADAFVSELAAAPYRRAARTSVAGAIEFGSTLFGTGGYRGIRRVLDISGDGANNQGPIVTVARDEALARGITINGLPVMVKKPSYATMDIDTLDIYYEDCVIGGPGAFVIPIRDRDKFIEATRTKLVLEIAGRVPEGRAIPASAQQPRVSCTLGERLWQERWGN
jgi:hypothetical protein